jgi:hypothetical protein
MFQNYYNIRFNLRLKTSGFGFGATGGGTICLLLLFVIVEELLPGNNTVFPPPLLFPTPTGTGIPEDFVV